jgi:hypothetical protein
MSHAMANLHDGMFHRYIFEAFTMEDKKIHPLDLPSLSVSPRDGFLENLVLSSVHLASTFQFIFRYDIYY